MIKKKNCEVFDNVCRKFVALKPYTFDLNKAMSIGNKIVIFQHCKSSLFLLDVNKYKWTEESFEITKDLRGFECVKMPQYLNSNENE